MSEQLPPPPVFKPKSFPTNNGVSALNESLKTKHSSNARRNSNNNGNNNIGNKINSNFLTSSFVSNEEYQNALLKHSPSISPMTCFTDMPVPDSDIGSCSSSPKSKNLKKRKRNSSINSSEEEIAKKKKELKNQHSIIEKRRRIKMNREFEALKFLVPACRLQILQGLNDNNNFDNSNMMHKLTVLQSTVEYIKYLHLIIKLMKLQMLIPKDTRENFKRWFNKNNNLDFVNFDLDLQNYRDLENDFNFEDQFLTIFGNNGNVPSDWMDPITIEIDKIMNSSTHPSMNSSHKQRSFSQSSIPESSALLLQEKIQENTNYKKCILQLQNDAKSFKLPLPAIIEKHPNLMNYSNTLTHHPNLPQNNYTHIYNQFSKPKLVIPNYPVPTSSLKNLHNLPAPATAAINTTSAKITSAVSETATHAVSDPEMDHTSAEIKAASQLLVQFKSDAKSKMPSDNGTAPSPSHAKAIPPIYKNHPSISNILN